MKTTYHYLDQIRDQYGNLLYSWGVYEKTIILEGIGEKPKMSIKILKQFESVKQAQVYLDKLISK